jgi:SAM-dependent methyltransferase
MSRLMLEPLQRPALGEWFKTDAGRYVLEWERAQVGRAVEDVFGFNALQVGLPEIDLLATNRMPLRFSAGLEGAVGLAADPARLPIATSSLDLLVLPHVLEFGADPHQILREAERVLMPEGQIVICGFNPLSLWGLARLARRRSHEFPWRGEFVGLMRLRDWLKLLGFELNGGQFGCYAPPFRREAWLDRARFMEAAGDRWWPIAGGVYVVRAIKRVAGVRAIGPTRRRERRTVPAVATMARRERLRGQLRLVPLHNHRSEDS